MATSDERRRRRHEIRGEDEPGPQTFEIDGTDITLDALQDALQDRVEALLETVREMRRQHR